MSPPNACYCMVRPTGAGQASSDRPRHADQRFAGSAEQGVSEAFLGGPTLLSVLGRRHSSTCATSINYSVRRTRQFPRMACPSPEKSGSKLRGLLLCGPPCRSKTCLFLFAHSLPDCTVPRPSPHIVPPPSIACTVIVHPHCETHLPSTPTRN